MSGYHYLECGLDNVFIAGLEPFADDDGEQTIMIPAIGVLHSAIARGIVEHPKGMTGSELRFLRTEMGMTQAEIAQFVHVDKQTIGRWERGETEFEAKAEALVRKLAIERLRLDAPASIEQLSARSVPTAETQTILVRKTDEGYEVDNAA